MTVPAIFDQHARDLRRARYLHQPPGYLEEAMAGDLLERLAMVRRSFPRAALLGANRSLTAALTDRVDHLDVLEPSPDRAAALGASLRREADLGIAGADYDLVVTAGALDTVDDLPGALVQLRRALVPDGLFLGAFFCAPSLPRLRAAVALADAEVGRAIPRFHPLIDPRSGGDLLVRAGFALPVADTHEHWLAYRSLDALLRDLRAAAATNVLLDRDRGTRGWYHRVRAAFENDASNGRTIETVSVLTLTGWAPSGSQAKPARRGSANVSLAAALRPPRGE